MGYFQVRYDSRVVNYDRRGFIRLATVMNMKLIGESSALRKLQILKIHQMHPIECPSLSCKYENSIENQA